VLAASERREHGLGALAAGAAGYLSKAAGAEELCEAVIATSRGGAVIPPALVGHLVGRLCDGGGEEEDRSLAARLSAGELEIVRLVAVGLTDKEIARQLHRSPNGAAS